MWQFHPTENGPVPLTYQPDPLKNCPNYCWLKAKLNRNPVEDPPPIQLDFNDILTLVASTVIDEPLEPERPLLYLFEHVTLRDAAFHQHPRLMEALTTLSPRPLRHFWSRAVLEYEAIHSIDYPFPEAAVFEAVEIHEPVRYNDSTLHILTMPTPQYALEAFMIGIVFIHDDADESAFTRYFTLEKSEDPNPLFCEWLSDETRRNYGEGPTEHSAFIEAIINRL